MLRYVVATVSSAAGYFSPSEPSQALVKHAQYASVYGPSALRVPPIHNIEDEEADEAKYETIYDILKKENLYEILGITPRVADDPSALRRAYLARSRKCHPDKFPGHEQATVAFQKISVAYNVLSDPSSRVAYDANPCATGDIFTNPQSADDTFDGVLQVFFADFMSGDFEVMRMVLQTMKEVNPAFRMEDETITNVIAGLRKLREVVLGTRTYVRVLRREILHLYDIQYSLRQLPYLAISARLRLTIKFTRVALSLPMAIDRAIEAEDAERQRRRAAHAAAGLEDGPTSANGQLGKRSSILGPKIGGVVNFLVVALEKSESVL